MYLVSVYACIYIAVVSGNVGAELTCKIPLKNCHVERDKVASKGHCKGGFLYHVQGPRMIRDVS